MSGNIEINTNVVNEEFEINDVEITIETSSLTKQQKAVVLQVYNKVRENLNKIINAVSNDSDPTKNIFELVCYSIKIIEKVKINRKTLSGEEKKLIVLELIRVTIHSEVKNVELRNNIIRLYDLSGEAILENVIDVSRNVNIGIKKGCNKLFQCCRN